MDFRSDLLLLRFIPKSFLSDTVFFFEHSALASHLTAF